MKTRKEIIEGLKWHIRVDTQCVYALVDCPYVEDCKDMNNTQLAEDVLELLSPVKPVKKDLFHWYCGRCGCRIRLKSKPQFCCKCGAEIGGD